MNIYPVIHIGNSILALTQIDNARRCGASGVFLISHLGKDDDVVKTAAIAKEIILDLKNFKIGINLLSSSPVYAFVVAKKYKLDMVWADYMGVSSQGTDRIGNEMSRLSKLHPEIQLFASVAFKYQKTDRDPGRAALEAKTAGFIPTTSGPGTGKAPDVQKIINMSSAVNGDLAIASGVTPENVSLFSPHVKHILVSTGISKNEYEIDPNKLESLIKNCD